MQIETKHYFLSLAIIKIEQILQILVSFLRVE